MRKPRALSSRIESVTQRETGHSQDMDDWQWLVDVRRPNGLIVGPDAMSAGMLAAFEQWVLRPVIHWPRDGAPWDGRQHPSTVILHDVGALAARDQSMLLSWMSDAGRDVQIISLASSSVYPLVQQGAFLAALYYRINCVYIDCSVISDSTLT